MTRLIEGNAVQKASLPKRLVRLLENWKVAWRNWRVRGTRKAYTALTEAMQNDSTYAQAWQCNIAMPVFDGAGGKLTHTEANKIADDLMRHLFGVKKPGAAQA